MLFKPAQNEMAFLKAGLMGFTASGKTHTASCIAIGLALHMRDLKLEAGHKPVMFLDTETGSDWVRPLFDEAGVPLMVAKTRSFSDLIPAIAEAEQVGATLLIDSITHFWRELTESYAKKKNRMRLAFEDWAYLKQRWGEFTDKFVNSEVHILMCGRAGYEYDFFTNEDTGKKELEKTGIKMKAETETGFEPSLLVLMERHMSLADKTVYREAHILKDRSRLIDGQTFTFSGATTVEQTYACFKPHIDFLNLGGRHVGVDTSRNSEGTIPGNERNDWKYRETQKAIYLDRIKGVFVEAGLDGNSADAKKARIDLLREFFGTNSWIEVEERRSLEAVIEGHDRLHAKLLKRWPEASPFAPPEEPDEEEQLP